ncbi:hypothetical protein CASFOL_013578 [Castilleja foliolosa]|uniref:Uncharacterized protein n=1 Tax=Castilleja foliolosa TaxID=1961234 RepID=A0ABD3DKD5_9LAMI
MDKISTIIILIGASSIIFGLWLIHCFYNYYCILSTKQFGPVLKLVLCICIPGILIAWPPIGIACSILVGAAYGLLAPMFATFQAVGEGKTDKFYHCICDGIHDIEHFLGCLCGGYSVSGRDLFDLDFVILLLYTMNRATIFLTCPKDLASQTALPKEDSTNFVSFQFFQKATLTYKLYECTYARVEAPSGILFWSYVKIYEDIRGSIVNRSIHVDCQLNKLALVIQKVTALLGILFWGYWFVLVNMTLALDPFVKYDAI